MKVGTWGIAHNAETWILVGVGIVMVGAMVWDFKTTNK